jgi:sigma-B regulation protein RsbU (phosphoserine phosphatase)
LNNSLVRGELGLRFYAAAPIVTADGYRLGTVNVIDQYPRELTDAQAQTLRDLAAVVADKLELQLEAIHAVRQERAAAARSQHLVRTLQRSLSPPRLPAVSWLQLATAYHPASIDDVGGDFYDFFRLNDGSYAMFIGDVCGKVARAAALTSLTRYTLRGAAIFEEDPAAVLAQLNAALLLEQQASGDRAVADPGDDELLCTVVYARLHPPRSPGDSALLTLAAAGHPAPMIVHSDHCVEEIACQGPMIGILAEPVYATAQVRLHSGDTLLLYTDGITDTRTPDGRLGRHGLSRILADGDTAPGAVIARLDTLLAGPDPDRRDDIAALALSMIAPGAEPPP